MSTITEAVRAYVMRQVEHGTVHLHEAYAEADDLEATGRYPLYKGDTSAERRANRNGTLRCDVFNRAVYDEVLSRPPGTTGLYCKGRKFPNPTPKEGHVNTKLDFYTGPNGKAYALIGGKLVEVAAAAPTTIEVKAKPKRVMNLHENILLFMYGQGGESKFADIVAGVPGASTAAYISHGQHAGNLTVLRRTKDNPNPTVVLTPQGLTAARALVRGGPLAFNRPTADAPDEIPFDTTPKPQAAAAPRKPRRKHKPRGPYANGQWIIEHLLRSNGLTEAELREFAVAEGVNPGAINRTLHILKGSAQIACTDGKFTLVSDFDLI